MADDIRAGDVVVCVDASVIECDCHIHTGKSLRLRATYRVAGVQQDTCGCDEAALVGGGFGLLVRFRKIDAPKTEMSERIRACRPIPAKEPA